MKPLILHLEDDPSMRSHIVNLLIEEVYNVKEVNGIDLAKEFFIKNKKNIDCIITDINMSDIWLENHKEEADGCILSGWVWLKYFIYPKKDPANIPTIIYSGYIDYLNKTLDQRNEKYFLEKYRIEQVHKGGDNDFKKIIGILHNKFHVFGENPK